MGSAFVGHLMEETTPLPDPPRPAGSARKHRHRLKAIEQFVVEEIELGDVPEVAAPKRSLWRSRPSLAPHTTVQVRFAAGWIGLWLALVLATLFARGAWPVDETRVLGTAWEMWSGGGFLVPSVNGEPVARAPLLYWLIHLGWAALGVSEEWARLVPTLFALGTLALMAPLARRLWPGNADLAAHAPWLLIGTFAMAFTAPLLLADMALVFFTVLAMGAAAIMHRTRDARAWLLLGLALGFGMLAHGALILVYVLPVVLAAPLWALAPARPVWRHWYADVFKAVLLAAILVAAWLLPASVRAGAHYALEFFTTTLGNAALEPFGREHPAWWYLLLLPAMCLPWSALPLVWIGLWRARREPISAGVALCLVWLAVPLSLLSFADIKQPQFLLPLLPAATLLAAAFLFDPKQAEHKESGVFSGLAIPLIVIGCALAVVPKLPRVAFLPEALWELSPFVGVGVVVLGAVTAMLPARGASQRVRDIATGGALLVVFLVLGAGSQLDARQRAEPVTALLARAGHVGRPIAQVGDYQGEFHFAARLTRPLAVPGPAQAGPWLARHPDGVIVTGSDRWQPPRASDARLLYEGPLGERTVAVWERGAESAPGP
jgi:4-amino-4-deoxy-L-arabinose transferase-like glycosyltransferase